MSTLETFMTYAAEFEKTLVDDDWARLEPFFAADAVYLVESSLFGCELTGPAAIFAGMKKSLDGFDRKFPAREIALLDGPNVDGNEIHAEWTVTYHKEGLPPFVLRGKSRAEIRDGKITRLVDLYDDAVNTEVSDWMKKTGLVLDPSYV